MGRVRGQRGSFYRAYAGLRWRADQLFDPTGVPGDGLEGWHAHESAFLTLTVNILQSPRFQRGWSFSEGHHLSIRLIPSAPHQPASGGCDPAVAPDGLSAPIARPRRVGAGAGLRLACGSEYGCVGDRLADEMSETDDVPVDGLEGWHAHASAFLTLTANILHNPGSRVDGVFRMDSCVVARWMIRVLTSSAPGRSRGSEREARHHPRAHGGNRAYHPPSSRRHARRPIPR